MFDLDTVFYGDTLFHWACAFGVILGVRFFLRLAKSFILSRLVAFSKTTTTQWDDFAVEVIESTRPFFFWAVSLYAGTLYLSLPAKAANVVHSVITVAVLFQVGIWASSLLSFLLTHHVKKVIEVDASSATTLNALRMFAKLVVWTLVFLMCLENLGVNITTLIAGLGVGGIAVALAAQNILADLFASLSIVLDKPFAIGDGITVGEYSGTVEYIGLKSTLIRSVNGEQIVFSNTALLNSQIRNFKRLNERRVTFTLGVAYETPHEKLQKIPAILREIIEPQPNVRFDRAHLMNLGASSLDFEVVYFYKNPDFNPHADARHLVNLAIIKRFAQEGIDFAYPTQTLHVKKT